MDWCTVTVCSHVDLMESGVVMCKKDVMCVDVSIFIILKIKNKIFVLMIFFVIKQYYNYDSFRHPLTLYPQITTDSPANPNGNPSMNH